MRSRRPVQVRGTGYVRTSGQSVKLNAPDGWMGTNGPVWWVGGDAPDDFDFSGYGYPAPPWPYNSGPIGRQDEWGGTPYHAPGRGILPAITRASNLVVNPVIRTTWRYMAGYNTDVSDIRGGTELLPRPLWIADPQLVGTIPGGEGTRPTVPKGKRLGAHEFYRTFLTHAVWWGKGAMLYVEDSLGQPLAGTLRIVNPAMWACGDNGRFILDPDGDEPIESDEEGYFEVGGWRWRMVTLRGFAPNDGATPEGALVRLRQVSMTGERMNNYLASVLHSGVPAGVLKVNIPNFSGPEAEALKERWMAAHGGSRKSVAVLNAGVDFTPLQLKVTDADVVNAKGDWRVDVAHGFNLSAAMLDASTGSGSNLTYANLGERRRDHLDHTLADWGRSMEDLITGILPYGVKMRVDWSGYLNTDPNYDLKFVSQGLAEGWLTIDEARDRLGLHPLSEGDVEDLNAEGGVAQ